MRNSKYYLAGSVSLMTFLVYLTSLRNDFVWDDMPYIVENPHIRSFNMAMLKWAFSHFYVANWHPLAWISHALDYAFWGLNPLGHHLTNVTLHTLNTLIVTFLTMRLIRMAKPMSAQNGPPSFLNDEAVLVAGGVTGILFGLHPLHAESAAWVAERKDLLCALFYLLSIAAYSNYARILEVAHQRPFSPLSNSSYLFSLGLFALALLSKPMAVSLPVVLLILDWYPFKRIQSMKTFSAVLLEKLPFISLSLVSSFLTVMAQRAEGSLQSFEVIRLSTRLLAAMESLIVYLRRMVLPVNLMPYYPYNEDISLFSLKYIGVIVLVLGITLACARSAKKQKVWLSAWSYYVISLLPTLGIIQVGSQASADRYTYLPSLGPFLVAGLVIASVLSKDDKATGGSHAAKLVSVATLLFVLLSMIYLTAKQILIRKDNIVIFSYIIDKEPNKVPFAYYNRGTVYFNLGEVSKAIEDLSKAITLNPSYYQAYYNRGTAYGKAGEFDKAVEDFARTIALNPSHYQAYYNRGIAFFNTGDLNKAVEDFGRAIALNPSYDQAYYNRGTAYGKAGEFNKAIEDFGRAIALNPSYYQAYYNRGMAFFSVGKLNEAVEDFDRTLALNPSYEQARSNRGIARDKIGQPNSRQGYPR